MNNFLTSVGSISIGLLLLLVICGLSSYLSEIVGFWFLANSKGIEYRRRLYHKYTNGGGNGKKAEPGAGAGEDRQ